MSFWFSNWVLWGHPKITTEWFWILFWETTYEHWKWQQSVVLFLEFSTFLISKYFKHDFITDWFCNFVEIHHWPVMNSKNDYRLVWICLGISAWNSHQHGEWLHFVFCFFRWKPLEPNIKPLRKPTLWFYFFLTQLNWHVLEAIITTDWF